MQTKFEKYKLVEIEEDFVEYISVRKNKPYDEVLKQYIEIRNYFGFPTNSFKEFWCENMHKLFSLEYLDSNEKELIRSYKFYSLLHLYEMISLCYKSPLNFENSAKEILNQMKERPIVVDYGCGIAPISFEIAKMTNSKTYLLDLDSIILDFTKFRFRKNGFDYETIPVTEDNFYPTLPKHNICICTEVLEHLPNSSKAFRNICKNLETDGILYGYYYDYQKEYFHVSPDLSKIRETLSKNFKTIDNYLHIKI